MGEEREEGEEGALAGYYSCGPGETCADGAPHLWDGPGIETETSSATCSKCGVDAMSHVLWNWL